MRRTVKLTVVTTLMALLLAAPAEAAFTKLGTARAASFMREALLRHPNLAFAAGSSRRVKCNKRISALRLRCRMSWYAGDLSFQGKGTIWITFPGGEPFWNYSYRIVRFNEYCAVVGGDDCTKTYVVR